MDASSCCLAEQLADRRPSIRQPLVGIAASVGEEDPVASPRGLHNLEVACEVVGAVQVRGHEVSRRPRARSPSVRNQSLTGQAATNAADRPASTHPRIAPAPADRQPFSRIPARSPSTRFRTSGSGLGSPIARGGVVEHDETDNDIVEPSVAVPHLRAQPADGDSGEWFEAGAGAGPSSRCPTANCKACRRG